MILVDSNIPMYLVGRDQSQKLATQILIQKLIGNRQRLVTDAEVLQEILHRYLSINRAEAIQPAFDILLSVADEVLPIDLAVAERAKQIVLAYRGLSARDAVHAAVMQQHGIGEILSFDKAFDNLPAIRRIH